MKHLIPLLFHILFLVVATDIQNFKENEVNSIVLETRYPPPPPVQDVARMARYVVHYSDWGTVSHISRQKNIFGFPTSRIYSVSDGPINISSGVPFLYVSFFDVDIQDLNVDNRCSVAFSLAEGSYCFQNKLDPEDPRCVQVILNGNFCFVKNESKDWTAAEQALFTRHPVMKTWPSSHHFTFAKVEVQHIMIVDYFGGRKFVAVEDYLNANPIQGIIKSIHVEMV